MEEIFAKTIEALMKHTYTLIKRVDTSSKDDYGHLIYEDDDPIVGLKCLYLIEDVENTDERGTVIEHTPTLYVSKNDTASEFDRVENVLDNSGDVILEKAQIRSIDGVTNFGDSIVKVCRLEGATV